MFCRLTYVRLLGLFKNRTEVIFFCTLNIDHEHEHVPFETLIKLLNNSF